MSRLTVTFNGIVITDYLTVTSLDRGVGTDNTNDLKKIGSSDGKYLTSTTHEEKIIPMGIAIIGDVVKKSRDLAGALNTKEPAKLIFSDEPDKYYLAVPDGDIPLRDIVTLGEGTINWLVPEGVAYSLEETEVLLSESIQKVDYKGTADTYPRFELTNKSDNGFFGVINQDGRMIQIGNPDDVDVIPYTESETVIREFFREDTGQWNVGEGVVTYPNYLNRPSTPNILTGTFDWASDYESIKPVYPAGSGNVWYGSKQNRLVPKTSEGRNTNNFSRKTRLVFRGPKVTQRGRLDIVVQSGEEILAAVVVRDSVINKSELKVEFWALGEVKATYDLDLKKFSRGFYESEITREGDTLFFKVSNIDVMVGNVMTKTAEQLFKFTSDEIIGKPVTSITGAIARFSDKEATNMTFSDDTFTWIKVDKINDIPNLFANDDILYVDNRKALIAINGVPNINIGVIGNDFFPLKSGENEINTLWSDWAVKPEIKMLYRERWK